MVGIEDLKYFRQHFQELFGMALLNLLKPKKLKNKAIGVRVTYSLDLPFVSHKYSVFI
jgi:hypothetical protein